MEVKNRHQQLLMDAGALAHGHFVYASGKHGEYYVNKTAGLVLASHAAQHAAEIAGLLDELFQGEAHIEAVVGPELGAVTLMADVRYALYLYTRHEVAGVIATKIRGTEPQCFEIVRDQARFIAGKRTIVVEDILTTGDSAKEAIAAARDVGANVVAVACLWNRGGVTAEYLGVDHLIALVDLQIEAIDAAECPWCKANVPINTDLGKGAEYLQQKAAQS